MLFMKYGSGYGVRQNLRFNHKHLPPQQRDSLAIDSVQSQFDRATAALELASEQQKVLAETIDAQRPDKTLTLKY